MMRLTIWLVIELFGGVILLMALFLFQAISGTQFFTVLQARHPTQWEALGKPGLFRVTTNWDPDHYKIYWFIMRGGHRRMCDDEMTRLGDRWLLANSAFLVFQIAIMLVVVRAIIFK